MNKRTFFSAVLRCLKLLYIFDYLRFLYYKFKHYNKNKQFKTQHPDVVFPSDYMMYEVFQMDYKKFYLDSQHATKEMLDELSQYVDLKGACILDWGCGPGRLIRHVVSILGDDATYFATDYNAKFINWCQHHLDKRIQFNVNGLEAKLPYPDNSFDVIYGFSIFTHLSKEIGQGWKNELQRVLKKDGVLYVTTMSDNFKHKLLPGELAKYEKGELVVRGDVKEGHRVYSTFHPPKYMRALFSDFECCKHKVLPVENQRIMPQDTWIFKK